MESFFRRYAVWILVGAMATLLVISEEILRRAGSNARAELDRLRVGALQLGDRVPSFQARTLAGNSVDFPAAYRGRTVLLSFWATWCRPCREEMPELVKTYTEFRSQGFDIVGISLDQTQGVSADAVAQFAKEQSMTWPQVYADVAAIGGDYRVEGIPADFLVDGGSGKLLAEGDTLRGDGLARTLARHFAATRADGPPPANDPRVARTRTWISAGPIIGALELFRADYGRYPTTAEGLHALLEPPRIPDAASQPAHGYLQSAESLKDSWGRELLYAGPGQHHLDAYDLWSAGPDGQSGSLDDITNWDPTERPAKKTPASKP
jgi:type II secretion system protein G